MRSVFAPLAAIGAFMSITVPAMAEPPEPGSKQHRLMSPYADFIKSARNCCDLSDGRADLEERIYTDHGISPDSDSAKIYQVKMTKAAFGPAFDKFFLDGQSEQWIFVEKRQVIDAHEAREICKSVAERNERIRKYIPDKPEHTCHLPPFNILWVSKDTGLTICYWPGLKLGLYDKDGNKFANLDMPTKVVMADEAEIENILKLTRADSKPSSVLVP